MKVKSITSETANPASSGYIELAKSDTIAWRNNANSGNLLLSVDGSDMLRFNGSVLGTTSLTNGDIYVGNASNLPVAVALSGDATLTNTGVMTIANNAITNVKVSTTAAIALTKLAAQTASRATVFDGSGLLVPSTTTSTQIGYLSTTTSDVQTQLGNKLDLSGGTMSGAINMASHKILSLTNGTSVGDAAAFGQIKVGQIVSASTSTAFTTTSSTFQLTNLAVAITPASSSSKFIILVSGVLSSQTNNVVAYASISRDPGSVNLGGSNGFQEALNDSGHIFAPCSIIYFDAPSTASQVTYTVTLKNSNNSGTVGFGDTNCLQNITVVEILNT